MSRTLGLRNRQRVRAVDTRLLGRIARWALEEQFHAADYELGLHLVNATEMARVNKSFLGHDGSTDVITFDHSEAGETASELSSGRPRPTKVGQASRLTGRAKRGLGRPKAAPCGAAGPARRLPYVGGAGAIPTEDVPPRFAPLHGEIFLCVDDAVAQAHLLGTTWQSELARYLLHGLLHLHGLDDLTPAARRTMKRQENRLLRLAQKQFPLRRLARTRS